MVEAQVHWSDSSDYMADAIAIINKAWTTGTYTRPMPVRTVMNFVYRTSKKTPARNSDLYDRFMAIVPVVYHREDETAWMLANLHLRHSTKPDTSRLMQILRSDQAHVQRWYRPSTYQAGLDIIFVTCAHAQRCIAEGRESDARWVMDNAYDRAPFLFSGGAALSSFKAETAAAEPTMAWMPPERELREGVRLDKDGNVYTMEKSQKIVKAFQYPSRKWTT